MVLLSDGVEGEEIPHLSGDAVEGPPGELAAKILDWGAGKGDDDATAMVFRLRSLGLPTS